MLNPYRMKALEGLLDYLSGLQGGDLKALMMDKPSPLEEAKEGPLSDALEGGDPKGIAVEKVSIMGKPEDKEGEEMNVASNNPMEKGIEASDDELDELYKKFRK